MGPLRIAVGIDYGTTWSAAAVAVIGNNQDGASDGDNAVNTMEHVDWSTTGADTKALKMVFSRRSKPTFPNDWQVILPDESRIDSPKTRLTKFGMRDTTTFLGTVDDTVDASDFMDDIEGNDQLDSIINASTGELLKQEHRRNSEPEAWLRKSMESMWTRFIGPLIEHKLQSVDICGSDVPIDVVIGIPVAWSISQSLAYAQVLKSGIPDKRLGSVSIISEAYGVLLGRLIEKDLDQDLFRPFHTYTMFDAGGGTVDIATFGLFSSSPDSMVEIPFLTHGNDDDSKPTPLCEHKNDPEHCHDTRCLHDPSRLCKHNNKPQHCRDCERLKESEQSDWFGFETIMARFKFLLEDPLHELLPSVEFGDLDLEDKLPEMMADLRKQLHDYSPKDNGDEDGSICLHDDRFVKPDHESLSEIGLHVDSMDSGFLIIDPKTVQRVFDVTVLPACDLLLKRIPRGPISRNHRVLVEGGFGQNKYLRTKIKEGIDALGPAAVPVSFQEKEYSKLTLAKGATYFAAGLGWSKPRLDVTMGIITHAMCSTDDPESPTKSWLQGNVFTWSCSLEHSCHGGLELMEQGAISVVLGWSDVEPETVGTDINAGPVRHSDASRIDNKIRIAAKLRIPLSSKAMSILADNQIHELGNNRVPIAVELRWKRTTITCRVSLGLLPQDRWSMTDLIIGEAEIDMVENYRPPCQANQSDLPVITTKPMEPTAAVHSGLLSLPHRTRETVQDVERDVVMGDDHDFGNDNDSGQTG